MEFDKGLQNGRQQYTSSLHALPADMLQITMFQAMFLCLVSDRVEIKCPSPPRHLRTRPSKLVQLEKPATNPRWLVGTRRAKQRMVRKGLF